MKRPAISLILRNHDERAKNNSVYVLDKDAGEVSVGKASITASSVCERSVAARDVRRSGLRARSATARLP